jgi:TRAP-type C4-dicarboxylate transport system substrate-binding protein
MMKISVSRVTMVSLVLLAASALPSIAADVTLKAISFDRRDSTYTRPLVDIVEMVNKSGTGLTIELIPDGTMSPFAMANAVKTGAVDIGNLPFTFYQNLLPIGDAMKLATATSAQLAQNGTVAFLDGLHKEKVNAKVLDLFGDGIKFYAYLRSKKIEKPDLTGLKMRITPIYRAAFRAFGADVVQMPPPDVYTALERGVIDGYGWTILDLPKVGWGKFTKYRIEPGFFQAWSAFIINLDSWNKLTPAQQKALTDAAKAASKAFNERVPALVAASTKEQAALGVEVIEFKGPQGEEFLKTVHKASWEEAESIDPANAKKLRQLIDR